VGAERYFGVVTEAGKPAVVDLDGFLVSGRAVDGAPDPDQILLGSNIRSSR